jgi:hypothetical protein
MKHHCRYCGQDHLEGSSLPLEDWDWRGIIELELKFHARAMKKPKCSRCRQPMLMGQEHWEARDKAGALPVVAGQHWACRNG